MDKLLNQASFLTRKLTVCLSYLTNGVRPGAIGWEISTVTSEGRGQSWMLEGALVYGEISQPSLLICKVEDHVRSTALSLVFFLNS